MSLLIHMLEFCTAGLVVYLLLRTYSEYRAVVRDGTSFPEEAAGSDASSVPHSLASGDGRRALLDRIRVTRNALDITLLHQSQAAFASPRQEGAPEAMTPGMDVEHADRRSESSIESPDHMHKAFVEAGLDLPTTLIETGDDKLELSPLKLFEKVREEEASKSIHTRRQPSRNATESRTKLTEPSESNDEVLRPRNALAKGSTERADHAAQKAQDLAIPKREAQSFGGTAPAHGKSFSANENIDTVQSSVRGDSTAGARESSPQSPDLVVGENALNDYIDDFFAGEECPPNAMVPEASSVFDLYVEVSQQRKAQPVEEFSGELPVSSMPRCSSGN